MHLLKLGDQIAKAIMLKLAQQRVRNVGRYVAPAGALADLGGKSLGNGGGQLLSPGRLTHAVILPMVGSDSPLAAQRGPRLLVEAMLDAGVHRRQGLGSGFG